MYRPIATIAAGLALLIAVPALAQTNSEEAGVRAALEHYLAGHATGDPKEFRQSFHDEARLQWIREGQYATRSDDEYVAGASGKPPADEAQRKRSIESIDITGTAASAKIVLDYPTVIFTDYMHLLKTADGWKIVNKTFYAQPKVKQ